MKKYDPIEAIKIANKEAKQGKTDFIEKQLKNPNFSEKKLYVLTNMAAIKMAESGQTKALEHLTKDLNIKIDEVIDACEEAALRNGHDDTMLFLLKYSKMLNRSNFDKEIGGFDLLNYKAKTTQKPEYEINMQRDTMQQGTAAIKKDDTYKSNNRMHIENFAHPNGMSVFIQNADNKTLSDIENLFDEVGKRDTFSMDEYIKSQIGEDTNIFIQAQGKNVSISMEDGKMSIDFDDVR